MPAVVHKRKHNEVFDTERAKTDRNYIARYWYYFYLFRAWPDWAEYPDELRAIYKERDRLRDKGRPMVVDHIVPLRSPFVCGLHVPWNLQIITDLENIMKSNKWWPDGPFEQKRLTLEDCRICQLRLI